MFRFADVPAVITALGDDVDFFPHVLANVSGPQFSGFTVERHAPDVAQSEGIDLRSGVCRLPFLVDYDLVTNERIVFGNGIGLAARFTVHIDPQD